MPTWLIVILIKIEKDFLLAINAAMFLIQQHEAMLFRKNPPPPTHRHPALPDFIFGRDKSVDRDFKLGSSII